MPWCQPDAGREARELKPRKCESFWGIHRPQISVHSSVRKVSQCFRRRNQILISAFSSEAKRIESVGLISDQDVKSVGAAVGSIRFPLYISSGSSRFLFVFSFFFSRLRVVETLYHRSVYIGKCLVTISSFSFVSKLL